MKLRIISCFIAILLCIVGCGETSEKNEVTITETPIIAEETLVAEETPVAEEAPVAEETDGVMVWIPTKGGKKYHSSETCSNMSDPEKVTINDAQAKGFTACKRCY